MSFKGMDIVSIRDLSREQIEQVLDLAQKMVPYAKGEKTTKALDGRILANLFFEPSTRTRLSFESAMVRMGGRFIEIAQPQSCSTVKGETLADTIRMVEGYADAIVLRHPHEGAARLAAHFSEKPVINAGDGAGQHPTQTLLDLFTIKQQSGSIAGKKVVLVGDLKYGRTAHSLAEALAMFGADLTFVAPPILQMPKETAKELEKQGIKARLCSKLDDVIADADVLYVTRIQRERFPDPSEYAKVAGSYRIDNALLREAKKDLVIMHPLPRVDEIAPEVDHTENAKYFVQAFNGVPVRMALLNMVLGGELQ
ncbi:aspartate carbamoyltransferase [Methanomassiliicoccus luminyensis]|uniref:aspartate carbamoyltransferase n=1 Tax=Methanomassiliicoccus luminyensis TaxID=1080712 RepID=UPI0004748DC3|nr:aspartate carbamoyltransferase [Methanomassiliicoccus luminyensis]